jgi:hypothetical protein
MSAVETLLSVVVGAAIGFLGSIGFDRWKEGREKKELKGRVREELELILQEVTSDYEKEAFQSRAFPTEVLLALREDFIRKFDAKTYRSLMETWSKIDELRVPVNVQELDKRRYSKTIEAIKKTIDLLK